MIKELADEVASELMTKFDKQFNRTLELIEEQQEGEFRAHNNRVVVQKYKGVYIGTVVIGRLTLYNLIKEAYKSRQIRQRKRTLNDRFLFYLDINFSKKYGIVTHSIFNYDKKRLEIQMVKPDRKCRGADMVMILTIENEKTNEMNLIVTDADDIMVSEVIELKKMVENRRAEWSEVTQEEILTLIERRLVDKGIKLIAYDNYKIKY